MHKLRWKQLPNKFLNAHQKRHLRWDSIKPGPNSLQSIWNTRFIILKFFSKVSSKCFVIINSKNCVPKKQTLKIRFLRVSSERSEAHNLLYTQIIICLLLLQQILFYLWYLAIRKWRFCSLQLSGWKCFIRKCFMQYFNFTHKFNS